mgnify:CR=1 FL=1
MKIAITTIGSRGDLQPFIALALGLKKTGHDVRIVTARNEENFVKGFDIEFSPVNVDIKQLMEGKEVQRMSKGNNPVKFISSHLHGSRKMKSLLVRAQHEIWEACSDAELLIFHPGMPIAFFKAQIENKKCIMLCPFPALSTGDYPSILFYNLPRFGKIGNRITHRIFYKAFWLMTKNAIKEFMKQEVDKVVNLSTSPIKQQVESNQPVINAYSSYLFSHSKDWAENVYTTGSLFIEDDGEYKPTIELKKFLAVDEPPIYIGFGSMKDKESFSKTIDIIEETARKTRQRFIVGLGWTNNSYKEAISENIFLIQSIPHTWLFQKVKLVIHHGGAGTTATGLLAGKPTIIIAHNADQPAWGKKIYELGLGAKPIRKKDLSSKRLVNAINYSLSPEVIKNANEMGKKMNDENGLQKAVNIINEFIDK